MDECKPNSNLSKKKEEIIRKGAKPVKVVKKTGLTRFAEDFVKEDSKSIFGYLLGEVLVPALKSLIFDSVTQGLKMRLWGDDYLPDKRSSLSSKISFGSYRNYSTQNDSRTSVITRSTYDFDDMVIFEHKSEAEDVLIGMNDILDSYHVVTVADFYELAQMSAPYTANRYGWTSLRTATIARVRDGYFVKLPKAMPID